ncbi:MAG: thiamine pyrophosphate-binding protein [Thermoguttaceae bacterium]
MIKLSDYVVQFLVDHGIHDLFLVSGGGIMHLLDSVGRNPGMRYYCNYHEQACAIAAEGYARVTGKIGACMVTTGPGGVNALSGLAGAWYDSIPILVVSGQVRRDLIADYSRLRSRGPQEGNVVGMARPVTKFARTIMDPASIRRNLEEALHLAQSGRPGPVWIDIPLDVQGSMIDETILEGFALPDSEAAIARGQLVQDVKAAIQLLEQSRRPVLVCGNGVHLSRSEALLTELIARLKIPVLTPHIAKDLVPEDDPLTMGVFGTAGQRRANFCIQNADCLLGLGVGLNCSKTGFNFRGFAPRAKKILVDIDPYQLSEQPVRPDLPVQADVGAFLQEMLCQLPGGTIQPSSIWLEACATWKRRYPIIVDEFVRDQEHVNGYVFMHKLSGLLTGTDMLVAGNGIDAATYWQAFEVRRGQRTMINGNWGSMGWDLPAAVGACLGGGRRRTICVCGDGSIQWNVQELLTIHNYRLPVKIFVYNNRGYTCIRSTQDAFFEGRYVGADAASGVSNPHFDQLAAAYGLIYATIRNNDELDAGLRRVLDIEGPVLCELNISPAQGIAPKASSFRREDGTMESRPLEDMAPFLPREEIWENMHLFDADEL